MDQFCLKNTTNAYTLRTPAFLRCMNFYFSIVLYPRMYYLLNIFNKQAIFASQINEIKSLQANSSKNIIIFLKNYRLVM